MSKQIWITIFVVTQSVVKIFYYLFQSPCDLVQHDLHLLQSKFNSYNILVTAYAYMFEKVQ